MKKFLHKTTAGIQKKLQLLVLVLLAAFAGTAQTYITQAAGNWKSPATWVGGQVPSATIAPGSTIIVKHAVMFDDNNQLNINGSLQIIDDTLHFPGTFNKHINISATGQLKVSGGGFIQDLTQKNSDLIIKGGHVFIEQSKFVISRGIFAESGAKRSYRHSTIIVGDKYEVKGTATAKSIDTIYKSTLELVGIGDALVKSYATVKMANARIIVRNGNFTVEPNSEIVTLAGAATNNYGFDLLKVKKNLKNDGSWDSKIDTYCVDGIIEGSNMAAIDFTRMEDCSTEQIVAAPELVFQNPVLVSGTANSQGAVYRFNNVAPGVDAEVKLKKFSRNDIVMQNIDLATMGWGKAFQPQFGLPGVVQPNQNWYVDFEMTFYDAGTTVKRRMSKVDLTALDVDGDSWSISEYVQYETPYAIHYSTLSYLSGTPTNLLNQSFTCSVDNVASPLIGCTGCGGDGKSGIWNIEPCTACDATGMVHSGCNHAYDGVSGSSVMGPVDNFVNIDTAATQVMATYQYVDKEKIRFRYGARSGVNSSNGSGIRLNSTWFRQFSLAPVMTLPVKISEFTATLKNSDVQLKWTSETEENFSHFVLQRSYDGKNFTDIAIVFAAGGSGVRTNYSYKDANVNTGMAYYRILCVDKTKETSYSATRIVRLAKDDANALTILTYPNPVKDQLRVTLPASFQGKKVTLELYNANGVLLQAIQLGAASQTEVMQIGNQSKGFYLVKATCEDQVAQQRIVKN